jgi:SET domain-containing protein
MNKTHAQSFKLKPSAIPGAGVGVFALHDIDPGVWLALKPRQKVGIKLQKADISEDLLDYCIGNDDGTYTCPPEFNHMHLVWYLNHSDTPNAERREDGYYSLREIRSGDEIVIDYNIFHKPGVGKVQYDTSGK